MHIDVSPGSVGTTGVRFADRTPLQQQRTLLLIYFLLLVHAQLARAHVDEENKAATGVVSCGISTGGEEEDIHDGQNLEEIVLGKVLVRVMGVKLVGSVQRRNYDKGGCRIQSRNY